MRRFAMIAFLVGLFASGVESSAQETAAAAGQPGIAAQAAAEDVRGVVAAFVAAAVSGRVDDARTLLVKGRHSDHSIREWREDIGAKSLPIASVIVAESDGVALAVSELVKLAKPEPDGQDSGRLIFELNQSGGGWLIRDIDFESEAGTAEKREAFKKDHAGAKELADQRTRPKIYALQNAKASALAACLRDVLPDSVTITFDERTNSLLVNCDPQLATQIYGLVQALDGVSAAGADRKPVSVGAIHFIPLKHATASSLASIVVDLFSTKRAPAFDIYSVRASAAGPELVVAADNANNWLLVRCADDRLPAIMEVVTRLDQPGGQQIGKAATATPRQDEQVERRLETQRAEHAADDPQTVYRQREEQARKTAQEYRQRRAHVAPQHPDLVELKADLHKSVAAAFEARQQHQRAELSKLLQRFRRIQELIESRERIKDKIIDHRVEELLNPELGWDAVDITDQAARNTGADEESRSEVKLPSNPLGIRVNVLFKAQTHSREIMAQNVGFQGFSILAAGLQEASGKPDNSTVAVATNCRLESFEETELLGKKYWKTTVFVPQGSTVYQSNRSLTQEKLDEMQERGAEFRIFPLRHDYEAGMVGLVTEPVWGEPVNGLQLGISGIRDQQHFASGKIVHFNLIVRNAGTEPVHKACSSSTVEPSAKPAATTLIRASS